jgi:hypothetical protein
LLTQSTKHAGLPFTAAIIRERLLFAAQRTFERFTFIDGFVPDLSIPNLMVGR